MVLEALGTRDDGLLLVKLLRRVVVERFGLNVVGAAEVAEVIDGWLAQRRGDAG
jgi:hypothetical protein